MIPKFRAWSKESEQMYDVESIDFFRNSIEIDNGYDYQVENLDCVIVMQSTGLVDKNVVEIFEGDILFNEHDEEYAEVVFKNGCFFIEATTWTVELYECCESWLIVGDIHQNPELLEVSHD